MTQIGRRFPRSGQIRPRESVSSTSATNRDSLLIGGADRVPRRTAVVSDMVISSGVLPWPRRSGRSHSPDIVQSTAIQRELSMSITSWGRSAGPRPALRTDLPAYHRTKWLVAPRPRVQLEVMRCLPARSSTRARRSLERRYYLTVRPMISGRTLQPSIHGVAWSIVGTLR